MSLVLSSNSPPHSSQRQRRVSSCSTGVISFAPSSTNHTDADSAKHVSFHSDVDVKRISASVPSLVTSETSIQNAILLAEEAKHIFSKLNTIPENNLKSIQKLDASLMSQDQVFQGRFFGLDALQDLDNAVNGSSSTPSLSGSSSHFFSDRKKIPSKMGPPKDSLRRMAVENNSYHYDQPSEGSRRRGRDSDFMSTAEETSSDRVGSYSSSKKNHSPYRTPTRTYFTDSEILRSPSEVLFAVTDKPGEEGDQIDNSNIVHSSSQTLQSELMKRRDSHPHIYDSYLHSKRRGNNNNPIMSQSLDGYIEEDKENSYKTRIHVISPDRQGTDASGRKPYKTTINTATDNIHYRQEAGYYDANGHYKVPRNKPLYNARYQATDSDSSAARYYASRRGGNNGDANNNNYFNSTRLVKHIETVRSDRDREGREISRRKGRTYSGCSTSPDREGSVERYSRPKPIRSYSNLTYHSLHQSKDRSPSSSPTRPYRSKSSHNRDERSKGLYYRSPSKNHISAQDRGRKSSPPEGRGSNERLSKFTEYRGDEEYSNYDSVVSSTNRRRRSVVAHNNQYNEELVARERGQSLPPGATIDSMGDFYKSNQYKSMYTLPPSPNRPAPILDRMNGTTLGRKERSKTNLEDLEGAIYTDDSAKISRPKLKDPKRRAPSPPRTYHYSNGAKIQIKRSEMPSGDSRVPPEEGRRGVNGSGAPRNHPSSRRAAYASRRRQSVDGTLDSSYSESDGMIGDNDQNSPGPPWSSSLSTDDLNEEQEEDEDLIEKEIAGCFSEKLSSRAVSIAHLSRISSPIIRNSNTAIIRLHPHKDYHQNANLPVAFTKVKRGGGHVMFYDDKVISVEDRPIKKEYGPGRRYVSASGNSDLDSDYRRELATHSRPSSTLNRSKKAGGSTSNLNTKSLDRRYRERHPIPGEIKRKLSPPSREEERRKVLEIERIHRQKTQLQQQEEEQQQQAQRSTPSRSGSRLGRVLGIGSKKTRHLSSDGDSQYTGGGSPKPPPSSASRSNSVPKINRYDQNTRGVKRNSSSSQFGVRREIHNRKKIPGSLTSSINSSESEGNGSGKAIILHNTAVAEIPVPRANRELDQSRRTVSESRENISSSHPSRRHLGNVNLQKSQKISRSISLLTPWKPRNYKDKFEGQRGKSPGKPPRPPSATRMVGPPSSRTGTMQRDKKSASSSDLLRDEMGSHPSGSAPRSNSRMETAPVIHHHRTHHKDTQQQPLTTTSSSSSTNSNSKVSRSVSMPKNSRLSGWFKKRK